MMRAKYYKKCIRQMRVKKSFVFFLVILIVVVIVISFLSNAIPVVQSFCKSRARYIALDSTNKSIIENIEGLEYEDLINVERDENNRVVSLSANTVRLTKLSTKITSDIKEKIAEIKETDVSVPITSILNLKMFSSVGPKLTFKLIPSSSVVASFKSEFEEAGINQVRNRIYIEVTTRVRFLSPISIETQEYKNEVNVVETILVGEVPATYYKISGMENLSVNDGVEFLE